MIRRPRQPCRVFRSSRGALVFVSAVLYLAAAGGIPLPAPTHPAAHNVELAFPCQHHACGCHDADQCWRDCCCFSQRQRLAWAASHHVHLPGDIHRQLSASVAPRAHACCAVQHVHDQSGHREHEHGADSDEAASPAPASEVSVFGNLVRHCRGLDSTWLAGVPVLPMVAAMQWQLELLVIGLLDCARPTLLSVILPTDTPPPRA